MGYTTDFVGHVAIEPPLNSSEQRFLTRFAKSRRMHRHSGPYTVGEAPERAGELAVDVIDSNQPPPGQPGLWCQWEPSCDGGCLVWDDGEKFYAPTEWMRYLVDHFLRPGALASTAGLPGFAGFTFDHHSNGEIAARRRDTGRLWLIVVDDNDVHEEERVAGVPTDLVWGPGMDYIRAHPCGPDFDPAYQRAGWPVRRPSPGRRDRLAG